jgi:hypothetical protein
MHQWDSRSKFYPTLYKDLCPRNENFEFTGPNLILGIYFIYVQWNLSNPTHQGTRGMCRNTQVLFELTEILWDYNILSDVTGCQKTQVSDCASSTVYLNKN